MGLADRIARGAGLKGLGIGSQLGVGHIYDGLINFGSTAGETVTAEKAIGLPAVFKAIRIISETSGALPLITYKAGEERTRDEDHPAYELLHEEPNPDLSATEFWTMLFAHLGGWGCMFIGKERRGDRVVRLHPIEPSCMSVERLSGGQLLFHESLPTGAVRDWTQRDLIYVRLFTVDGVRALSPIGMQRETMGLAIAMRRHGASFFRDAAIPSGALSVREEVKDPAVRARIKAEWKAAHQGKRDIALLDAGASFDAVSIPLRDAEFVELWGATKADIADTFNMPASLLNAPTGDSFTYGNRESDMQQFLTFTLHNPLKKVEQALTRDRDLFPRLGKRTHLCEFLREDLLRPDSRARATFYRLALDERSGWMTRAEARRRENLPAEEPKPDDGSTSEEG